MLALDLDKSLFYTDLRILTLAGYSFNYLFIFMFRTKLFILSVEFTSKSIFLWLEIVDLTERLSSLEMFP
jgi:hypothetical protein